MPRLHQKLLAAAGRLYPFYSGNASLVNGRFFRSLSGSGDELAWARLDGGMAVRVPLDDFVGRAAYYTGQLDYKIAWVARRLVRPGDVVADIGANLGVVTLALGKLVGPTGTVHSFEPNPRMLALLRESIARNKFDNVKVHDVALGSERGFADLHIPDGNAGAGSLTARRQGKTVSVPVHRFDDLFSGDDVTIRFIKIDVEGFEPQVLAGMENLLSRRAADAILFELNDVSHPTPDHPTLKPLLAHGYRLFAIPHCKLRMQTRPFDPAAGGSAHAHDFLAVPADERFERVGRLINAR